MSKKRILFKDIEDFFKDYEFSDDHLEISPCETITDIKQFVTSHMEIIKNNQDKPVDTRRRLTPYWDRLVAVYKMLNLNQ